MTETTEPVKKETAVPESEAEDFAPAGTLAVMAILAVVILSIWLILYFGVFVPRGGVS